MDAYSLENWDQDRYLELNTYFRVRIQRMMDGDPYIKELLQQEQGLELQDIIDRLSERDQELWDEFIRLDRIKLHQDLRNHLEGRGTPYKPGHGFRSNTGEEDDTQQPW